MDDKYLVIAVGSEHELTVECASFEDAQNVYHAFKKNFLKGNDLGLTKEERKGALDVDYDRFYNGTEIECAFGSTGAEKYQSFMVVKKPKTELEEILIDISKAKDGLAQYSFELQDTDTCRKYLDEIENRVKSLIGKELYL